jgi:hypothetical protein
MALWRVCRARRLHRKRRWRLLICRQFGAFLARLSGIGAAIDSARDRRHFPMGQAKIAGSAPRRDSAVVLFAKEQRSFRVGRLPPVRPLPTACGIS